MERKTEKICPRNDKIVKILTPGDLLYPNMRKDNGPTKTSVMYCIEKKKKNADRQTFFFCLMVYFQAEGGVSGTETPKIQALP